jgi:hypothetical protein
MASKNVQAAAATLQAAIDTELKGIQDAQKVLAP